MTYRGSPSKGGNRPAFIVGGVASKEKSEAFIMLATSTFLSRYSGWRYLNCHSVNWLVDKQPIALPSADHRGNVNNGTLLEFISIKLSGSELARLAVGDYVEYRICNDEFALMPDDLDGLKRVAAALGTGAATANSPQVSDKPKPKADAPDADCEACKKISGG